MPENTLSITDNRTNKTYTVPVENGTIRAMDLRQIKTGAQHRRSDKERQKHSRNPGLERPFHGAKNGILPRGDFLRRLWSLPLAAIFD